MKKSIKSLCVIVMAVFFLIGCGTKKNNQKTEGKVALDPENPVSIRVWHYYNGSQQAAFDELVNEFNSTKGKELGINVEGISQGTVSDLAKTVSDSIDGKVGVDKLPNIFSSYADTAYYAQQKGKLVDLSEYFSKEEVEKYVDSYIEEGYLKNDKALYLFPVAKSTESLMINKTDWEPFAKQTGLSLDELKTVEGVVKVAKRYYEWTDAKTPNKPNDGKAFYGRDSMANYFVIGMKQLGKDIFEIKDGNVTFNVDKKLIKRLWENYKVQQGADMAVTKSDKKHEYASCVFIKWFTQKEQNLQFVCESAYMPVLKSANNVKALDDIIEKKSLHINNKTYDCLKNVMGDFDNTKYYTTKNFENGSSAREVLETNLSSKAQKDRKEIEKALAKGMKRSEVIKKYTTEKAFDKWYGEFSDALSNSLK